MDERIGWPARPRGWRPTGKCESTSANGSLTVVATTSAVTLVDVRAHRIEASPRRPSASPLKGIQAIDAGSRAGTVCRASHALRDAHSERRSTSDSLVTMASCAVLHLTRLARRYTTEELQMIDTQTLSWEELFTAGRQALELKRYADAEQAF